VYYTIESSENANVYKRICTSLYATPMRIPDNRYKHKKMGKDKNILCLGVDNNA